MAKSIYIGILIFSVLSIRCTDNSIHRQKNELFTINELILLRAQGFLLAETLSTYTQLEDFQEISKNVIDYYRDTDPDFWTVCKKRIAAMEEDEYDDLLYQTKNGFINNDRMEDDFVTVYKENISRSIILYKIIINRNEWKDLSRFSQKALPGLYAQQKNIERLQLKIVRE